jgi:phosphatidate cytidylyltransferase
MFKQRLLTTIILIPLVLAAIFYANYWVFGALILLLITGCALEWLPLIPIQSTLLKFLFFATLLLCCYLIQITWFFWLLAGIILWAMILIFVQQYPKSQVVWGYPWVVSVFCLLLLPLFGQSLMAIFLLEKGKGLIVYLLFLVWGADIGAYLAGKQLGRHKLIPQVSPGKTIEGVLGGFFLSMLVALAGYFCFQPALILNWFMIAILVVLVSLLGDLFISLLKRRVQVKDTGHLLPGHGGILDRLDSLIAAAPFFYCGFYFLAPGL